MTYLYNGHFPNSHEGLMASLKIKQEVKQEFKWLYGKEGQRGSV